MKTGLSVKIDRTKEVLSALNRLALESVYVGVPEEKSGRDDKEAGGPANNAMLARIHEYGAPAAHIPARPFLEPGIMQARDQVAADLREGAKEALDTMNPKAVGKALNKAGMHAAQKVQEQFTDNNWQSLAEGTQAARMEKARDALDKARRKLDKKAKREKWSDDKWEEEYDKMLSGAVRPLIDTGSLRSSISYEVR